MADEKKPIRVGILTISDTKTLTSSADDKTFDSVGYCLKELIKKSNVLEPCTVVAYDCVPKDFAIIQAKMIEWCSEENVDVLLTTGGNGLSPRDVTPEATLGVIQKQTPGITNAIMNESLKITPLAMVFRGVSGIYKKTLIINLPDIENVAIKCLQMVACTIPLAISSIKDEKGIMEHFHESLSSQDSVTKKACIHKESLFPEISLASALIILQEQYIIQCDDNGKIIIPSVWIFSVGDKLVDYSNKCLGSIIETNTTMIEQILEQDKYEGLVSYSDFVKENFDDVCKSFEEAFNKADVVVTTGGVSMGENDLMKDVLTKHFNSQILFSRVNMKPGMSTTFVMLSFKGEKKYVFCFPGDPVSAGVCTHLFLLPYLRSVTNKPNAVYKLKATLTHSIDELDVRPEYKRATLKYENGEFLVSISANQHCSSLLSFFGSNCLLKLPSSVEKTSIASNTVMEVIPIKSIENTYISPILTEKNWNITVLKQSYMDACNNDRVKPDLVQSSCLCLNEILDFMENMFILCTKCVYTTSAMGYVSEIEIASSNYKFPNFPPYVNDGYPSRCIDTDPWSRRDDILNVIEVSLNRIAPNYPKEKKREEPLEVDIDSSSGTFSGDVEDTSVMPQTPDGTTEIELTVVEEPEDFGNRHCLVDDRIELGPLEIAYLYSVGRVSLTVYRYPAVRIIPYSKYSMCETSNLIKNILEVDGFKERVYTYPICQQLSDIAVQYEDINYADDVIIICAENDVPLSFEEIGDVEGHYHIKNETISFGFGAIDIDEDRLIFFHTTSCNPDHIYSFMHLFVLPFLRFTSGRKQRISTIKAKCNTPYLLPTDRFEKCQLRYDQDDFEANCNGLNRPSCLVKKPLVPESSGLSRATTKLDVIVTENSDSYFIHY